MKSVNNQQPEILAQNDTEEKLKKNMNKYDFSSIDSIHEAKIAINAFTKKFEELGIPVFIAAYTGESGKLDGYVYDAVLPEEIGTEKCESQYQRFMQFIKVVIDFNKEDYMPYVKIND